MPRSVWGSGEPRLHGPTSTSSFPHHEQLIRSLSRDICIMSKTDAIEGPAGAGEGPDVHPAVRNAVRLCLSAREYRLLHDLAIKRAPDLKNKLPPSLRDDPPSHSRNRHNMAALRASLRIFVGSSIALSLGEKLLNRIQGNATK